MHKKLVIVTGATSGIGFSICKTLLQRGYAVVGMGRSGESCRAAEAALLSHAPGGDIRFVHADLMHQEEVKRAARQICAMVEERGTILHALINNAGCMRSSFATTREGYEQQFALNYLAGFLLTQELLPQIKASNAAVLFTSSASHKLMKVNWKDLMFQKRYRPLYAYKQSKLCNMLFSFKLRDQGVRSCGVAPGLVRTDIGNKGTGGMVHFVWKLRKKRGVPPDQSAEIYMDLCENGFSGLYYGLGCKELRASRQVNSKNAEKLYLESLRLCGLARECAA